MAAISDVEVQKATFNITLLSSLHGRDRRVLRGIEKIDLQAAIKYGEKLPGYPCKKTGAPRWKYTFADIVFITDETSTLEITSYVLPKNLEIQSAAVSEEETACHERLTQLLRSRPASCTSHTVLVVDQSGSMSTCDVRDYRTRSDAVISTLALDFVGKQIDQRQSKATDVVSLISMKDGGQVIFEREPITNVLFNKLVQLRTDLTPSSHGNYLPAIELAKKLLQVDNGNNRCALMLMFLSDGKPSDHFLASSRSSYSSVALQIELAIQEIARMFGPQLRVEVRGFGKYVFSKNELWHHQQDFPVLRRMSQVAQENGSTSSFEQISLHSASLSTSFSSLVSKLTETKTSLDNLHDLNGPRLLRTAIKEDYQGTAFRADGIGGWKSHSGISKKTPRWENKVFDWVVENVPWGIAIREKYFGRGAERITYQFVELNALGQETGVKLVAKESVFVDEHDEFRKEKFHQQICKLQMKSRDLAMKFNEQINALVSRNLLHPDDLAILDFIPISIYVFSDGRSVMVERALAHDKFYKWNDNNGFVDDMSGMATLQQVLEEMGISDQAPGPPLLGLTLPKFKLSVLREEDEDEEEDDKDEEFDELHREVFEEQKEPQAALKEKNFALKSQVKLKDFPQAFSHFTYRETSRKMMVVDIQGELEQATNLSPAIFRLTDPVIHHTKTGKPSKVANGRQNMFGRTDLGKKGFRAFFRTHECNELCRLLGLPDSKRERKSK